MWEWFAARNDDAKDLSVRGSCLFFQEAWFTFQVSWHVNSSIKCNSTSKDWMRNHWRACSICENNIEQHFSDAGRCFTKLCQHNESTTPQSFQYDRIYGYIKQVVPRSPNELWQDWCPSVWIVQAEVGEFHISILRRDVHHFSGVRSVQLTAQLTAQSCEPQLAAVGFWMRSVATAN